MARYMVSGVTGHVGSVVASELLAAGESVRVFIRDAEKAKSWASRGAEVAIGSLSDPPALASALKGVSGMFVLLPPDMVSPDFYGAQRHTADAIADAVRRSSVPSVVMLSSVGADLSDGNGPVKGLHYLENVLRKTGAQVSAIRASYFQENVESILGPARQAGIFPNFITPAEMKVPMIATRDIGRLGASLLRAPAGKSEAVDLIGPEYSMRQVAEKLGVVLGKTLQIVDIPPENHISALTGAGLPRPVAEAYAELYQALRLGLLKPVGDRTVHGTTMIDEVLPLLCR